MESGQFDKKRLLSRTFGIKADGRSVRNYEKVLDTFYSKKQATPMQIIKNTRISASTLYNHIIPNLKPIYLKKVGDVPSKRGPTETNPVYQLTAHGILLLGFLHRNRSLILEAINLDTENPFHELVAIIFKEAPEEVLLEATYYTLERRDLSVEAYFEVFDERTKSHLKPPEIMTILDILADAYSKLPQWKQGIVLDYFIGRMKEHYFTKLKGSDIRKYYEETKKYPRHIVYLCHTWKTLMKTESPFKTPIFVRQVQQKQSWLDQ